MRSNWQKSKSKVIAVEKRRPHIVSAIGVTHIETWAFCDYVTVDFVTGTLLGNFSHMAVRFLPEANPLRLQRQL